MQKINKSIEPKSLARFKKAQPGKGYKDLPAEVRQDIRLACSREQFYLCGYCCQRIRGLTEDTTNEHVIPQQTAPRYSLDFNNIIASCTTAKQCDKAHGTQELTLTPLMQACESELNFKLSGRVEGSTERARKMIRVLNLGESEADNKSLIEKRKRLVGDLLWVNGLDPSEGLEDEELLAMVIDDLLIPRDGQLENFAPVVVNILRGWIV